MRTPLETRRATCAAALLLFLTPAWSCLEEVDLEGQRFACTRPSDCVEGYFCHPGELVCVPTGTSTVAVRDAGSAGPDGSTADAGPTRPGLGERCEPAVGCRLGFCVDGVCCSTPCSGTCERCDVEPGLCRAVADGTDPDDECGGLILRCEDFTCGLDGNACRSCAVGESSAVCNGARACRPRECPPGTGAVIAECPNPACRAPDACPRGRPVAEYDSPEELCASGQSCPLANADGCCSGAGTCCPSPACDAVDPLCE